MSGLASLFPINGNNWRAEPVCLYTIIIRFNSPVKVHLFFLKLVLKLKDSRKKTNVFILIEKKNVFFQIYPTQ